MATIQWRPEINALTTPQSYRILAIPRNSAGTEDLAADISLRHPNFDKADILTILRAEDKAIQARLLNGEQVTKEGCFSWYLSFTGKLDNPDDSPPSLNEALQVRVRVSPPFVTAVRQGAQTERLPAVKKAPLINTAEDTLLELNNVLNPSGLLRLTGKDLSFDYKQGVGACVIHGTRSGESIQSRFGKITDSEVIIMPDIPAQDDSWNNEYTVSISTRYSEHGTLRTGVYTRSLRTPLAVNGLGKDKFPEVGILTGAAASPTVSIIGGKAKADEVLRVQAVFDLRQDCLLFSLLNMTEGGRISAAISVCTEGEYGLTGFAGSVVTSLRIRVNDYTALRESVRDEYSGRLVDVLAVTT